MTKEQIEAAAQLEVAAPVKDVQFRLEQAIGGDVIEQASLAIRTAGLLLFSAGAGMGVDSGLPDFRGDEGFWRAYPPFETGAFLCRSR